MTTQELFAAPVETTAPRHFAVIESPTKGMRPARMRATAHELLSTLLGLRARNRPAARVQVRISVYSPNGRSAIRLHLGR